MDYQTIIVRLAEWGHAQSEIIVLNTSVWYEEAKARFAAPVEPLERLRADQTLDERGHRMLDAIQVAYGEQVLEAMQGSLATGRALAINEMLKIIESCMDQMPELDDPDDLD
jgi:hypothetical protein